MLTAHPAPSSLAPMGSTVQLPLSAFPRDRGEQQQREGASCRGIQLLLERANTAQQVDVLPLGHIDAIKLRGQSRAPWWQTNRGRSFVLGSDLVRHAESAARGAGEADAYHVFCKLEDLDSLALTANGATRTLSRQAGGEGRAPGFASALSAQLSSLALEDSPTAAAEAGRGASFTRRASAPALGALDPPSSLAGLAGGPTVVHLIVRRSCKIGRQLHGREFELTVDVPAHETAEAVLRRLEAESGLEGSAHRLLYNGEELTDKSLAEYKVPDGAVLELVPYEPPAPGPGRARLPHATPGSSHSSVLSPEHGLVGALRQGFEQMLFPWTDAFHGFQAAQDGLRKGQLPRLAGAGSGGSYFISDAAGLPCAVFKPVDEEPLAEHNPRVGSLHSSGTAGSDESPTGGLRSGVFPGEGAVREVAAYLLDHGHFAGVPPTALVACHPSSKASSLGSPGSALSGAGKVGSLQQFVSAHGDCEEMGVGQFPVAAVQRIAALDLRLANTDRNASNILARRTPGGSWALIPIDHAYTLPGSFEDIAFDWLYWPQARKPWLPEVAAYVGGLDAEADLALLAAHGLLLRPECERVFRVTTSLLKKGVARGFTPATIGALMCRPDDESESALELLHARVAGEVGAGGPGYAARMEAGLEALLDEGPLLADAHRL